MGEKSDYLLGDADEELLRLATQHRVWSEHTHACWRHGGLGAGDSVLDLGAGPGFTSIELAQWVGPSGRVVAFDQSARFLDHVECYAAAHGLSNVAPIQGDITEIDLKERFDAIHARWVFCFLADPAAVVRRLAALLRPGGRLLTLDYYNYRAFCVAPRIPVMTRIVDAIQDSWSATGGSLEVQGGMAQWMVQAGLQVTEVRNLSISARPGEPLWEWPRQFLAGYLPRLVSDGRLAADEVDAFWSEWDQRIAAGGSYLCLPPLVSIQAVA